jgi:hypothetical protein
MAFHDILNDPEFFQVIPVNLHVTGSGRAVMGAGLALAAARRYPDLPLICGEAIRYGHLKLGYPAHAIVHVDHDVVLFPTKDDWRQPSRLEWIAAGLADLRTKTWLHHRSISFPRLGCGLGGLDWRQVRPLIEAAFADYSGAVRVDGEVL